MFGKIAQDYGLKYKLNTNPTVTVSVCECVHISGNIGEAVCRM